MTFATHTLASLWTRRGRRLGCLVLAVVAAGVGTATYAISSGVAARDASAVQPASAAISVAAPARAQRAAAPAKATPARAAKPPAAAEFAGWFLGVTNAYSKAHGDSARLANADCVQGSPGHYMCSYAVSRPNHASECHLMQAVWTPQAASSFTVTLSGRAERCGSLREALRSLQ